MTYKGYQKYFSIQFWTLSINIDISIMFVKNISISIWWIKTIIYSIYILKYYSLQNTNTHRIVSRMTNRNQLQTKYYALKLRKKLTYLFSGLGIRETIWWHEIKNPGHFNPKIFNPALFRTFLEKSKNEKNWVEM